MNTQFGQTADNPHVVGGGDDDVAGGEPILKRRTFEEFDGHDDELMALHIPVSLPQCSRCELYFDGACVPNPGKGRAGFTLDCDCDVNGRSVVTAELGESTNNVAEYFALIRALQYILARYKLNGHLTVRGDSNLVINQVFGKWRIKVARLKPLHQLCCGLLQRMGPNVKIIGEHVAREFNRVADEASKAAVTTHPDGYANYSHSQLSFVKVVICNVSALATHDCVVGAHCNCIDSTILFTLPGIGSATLQSLQTATYEILMGHGKIAMSVLGQTMNKLSFQVTDSMNQIHNFEDHFLVVDNLPTPMHIHLPDSFEVSQQKQLDISILSEPFRSNVYWRAIKR
jgi:ribonuclease HI